MSAFDDKRAIEAQAFEILRPYLVEQSNGRYVVTSKGPLARALQESVGDVIINTRKEEVCAFELKAERRFTGNLFLETWSNKNLNVRTSHATRGGNPGWLYKIRADVCLYYFLDVDKLYSIDVFTLKRWAFGHGPKGMESQGRIFDFPERLTDVEQENDTWGRCVPISILAKELRPGALKQTTVKQLQLLNDEAAA